MFALLQPETLGSLSPFTVCVAAATGAAAGSVLPLSPTEPFLLALAAVSPPWLALPIACCATAGHMTGKALVFAGARRAGGGLGARQRRSLRAARAGMMRAPAMQSLTIFTSGLSGLPPFYGVTLASGILGISARRFFLFGSLGRAARFALVVMLPQLVRFT